MRILLGTHAFIWFAEDDTQLDQTIKRTIEKTTHDIYLSIASIWKMAIKMQLKKLKIDKSIEEIFDAKLGTPESDELEILGLMVDNYENKHYPIEAPDPIEAIKIRMKAEENLQAKSLKSFYQKYPDTKPIRTSMSDYREEGCWSIFRYMLSSCWHGNKFN